LRSFDDALPGLEELERAFSPVFHQHVNVLGPSIELRFPAPSYYGGTCGGGGNERGSGIGAGGGMGKGVGQFGSVGGVGGAGNGPCFIDGVSLWGESMGVLAPSVCLRGLPQMQGIQVEPGISQFRRL